MAAQIKQEDIIAKYQDLPGDLQKALVSPIFSNAMTDAGKKNGLAIDKIGELADETGRVMLGITPPSDYVKNLGSRLSVSQEKARAIAEEINQKIFQPVRESLKKIHGIKVELSPPLQDGGGRSEGSKKRHYSTHFCQKNAPADSFAIRRASFTRHSSCTKRAVAAKFSRGQRRFGKRIKRSAAQTKIAVR